MFSKDTKTWKYLLFGRTIYLLLVKFLRSHGRCRGGLWWNRTVKVEQTPLFYYCEHSNYLKTYNWSVCGAQAKRNKRCYIWRKGLLFNAMLAWVCHDAYSDIKSARLEWTNPMSNFPHLLRDDRLFRTGSNLSASKALPCLEQKNIIRMMYINRQCILFDRPVVNHCASAFSAAEVCMLLLQHRRLIRCDLDSDCAASSLLQLIPMFACQVFKKESDIIREKAVNQAAFLLVKTM